MDRFLFLRSRRVAGVVALACACLTSAGVVAQNTTWTGNAGDGEWNTSANWSNGLPQAGAAVTFGPSSSTTIHAFPVVSAAPGTSPSLALASWSFPSGAPSYQFNLDSRLQSLGNNNFQQAVAYFDFTGTGISNQSGVAQTIAMANADLVTGNGGTNSAFNSTPATIRFFNTASAGTQITYSLTGSARYLYKTSQSEQLYNRPDATMAFYNQSTASGSSFLLGGGSGATAAGGTVNFYDTSTAGGATFDLLGGVPGANFTTLQNPVNGYGGELLLHDQASAGTATVTVESEASGGGGNGGQFVFFDQSRAGSAAITIKGTNTNGGSSDPGHLFFENSASADHSTISNNGTTVQSGFSGITRFDNTATASYATISNLGSTNQFTNASKTVFYNQSTADHATINNYASAASGSAVAYGETDFYDTSTAANATITNYEGSFSGQLVFHNNSTAASAIIHNGASVPQSSTAQTFFYDSSTLGTATFNDSTVDGGELQFHNNSTASQPSDPQMLTHSTLTLSGSGRFYDNSSAANTVASMRAYAHLLFYGTSTMATMQLTMSGVQTSLAMYNSSSAGQATITANGATSGSGIIAPLLTLSDSSTLAQAIVTLNGGAANGANGANGANLTFVGTSHPAQGTIICNPGPSGGEGGNCFFQNTFTASDAPRLVANGGAASGYFDFESEYNKSPTPAVGSIEGSGDFYLRGAALTVGSLNTDTVVTGRIIDDSVRSGGSLTKTGTGTLSLNGTCTYTGATNLNQGALSVGGSLLGSVNVASGTILKGAGTVKGVVTVAAGGTVAPGNSPGTITIGSASFATNSILEIECSDYATDHLVVTGGAVLHNLINIKILPGSSASAFENEIITVAGTLDLSGLRIGSVPPGLSASNFSLVQNGGHLTLHYSGSASGSSYSFFQSIYFTPAQQNDPSISGPSADPDHDGLTNGIEYALGLDPTNSSGSPFTTGSQASPNLSGNPRVLTLSFTVPTTAPSGATLNVQQGTDLASQGSWPIIATRNSSGTWTTYNNASIVLGTTANGRVPVTIIGSQPPKAFMRVEVTLP